MRCFLVDLVAKFPYSIQHSHHRGGVSVPIDQSRLGQHIQEQMQAIENDPEVPEDAEIGAIVTIVEIGNQEGSGIRVRANCPAHIAVGLLETAKIVQLSQ